MLQDSPHFKNEQRKQAQTEERIRKMQVQAKALSAGEIAHHTRCSTVMDLVLVTSSSCPEGPCCAPCVGPGMWKACPVH